METPLKKLRMNIKSRLKKLHYFQESRLKKFLLLKLKRPQYEGRTAGIVFYIL